MGLSCKPNIFAFWSTSKPRVRLAPWNRFKPFSKIFYWPFHGGTSFVDHLCFCVLFLLFLRLLFAAMWSPAGKGLTSWLLLVMFIVFCYFPMWYSLSGLVHDCIVSWSLPPFFLWTIKSPPGVVASFLMYLYKKLQASSPLKSMVRIQRNLAEMTTCYRWPSTKISSEIAHQNSKKFGRNDHWLIFAVARW